MTSYFSLFCSYRPCAGNRSVKIAVSSFSIIAGVGNIKISSVLTLTNVLHVPSFSCNLISVAKLTSDLQCSVFFSASGCVFQDQVSGRTIGIGRLHEGLYVLVEGIISNKSALNSVGLNSVSAIHNSDVFLWHFRLGHPSFFYLKQLFPTLFGNKHPSSFHCEICAHAKLHKSSYHP